MCKFFGLIIILLSSTLFFNQKTITDYYTYIFLEETVKILKLLKIECATRKTYSRIFNNIFSKKYKFYNNADFINKNNIFGNCPVINLVNKNEKNRVSDFFSSLGTKEIQHELEHITNQTEYFEYQSNLYKQRFEKNKQVNIISGFSFGIIIFLLII